MGLYSEGLVIARVLRLKFFFWGGGGGEGGNFQDGLFFGGAYYGKFTVFLERY